MVEIFIQEKIQKPFCDNDKSINLDNHYLQKIKFKYILTIKILLEHKFLH